MTYVMAGYFERWHNSNGFVLMLFMSSFNEEGALFKCYWDLCPT